MNLAHHNADTEDHEHFFDILQWKSDDSGSHYKQISKLALASMESEHQVVELLKRIGDLEAQKKTLTKQKIAHAFKSLTGQTLVWLI